MYPSTKIATEAVLPAFAADLDVELAMLHFASVYGDGKFVGGSSFGIAMSQLVETALDGRSVAVPSRMAQLGDVVYAKNAAAAVSQALHAPQLAHHVYNVGGGKNATAEELLDALRKAVPGVQATLAAPDRDTHAAKAYPMSLERSRAELGYAPEFDLEAGVSDYVRERQEARRRPPGSVRARTPVTIADDAARQLPPAPGSRPSAAFHRPGGGRLAAGRDRRRWNRPLRPGERGVVADEGRGAARGGQPGARFGRTRMQPRLVRTCGARNIGRVGPGAIVVWTRSAGWA